MKQLVMIIILVMILSGCVTVKESGIAESKLNPSWILPGSTQLIHEHPVRGAFMLYMFITPILVHQYITPAENKSDELLSETLRVVAATDWFWSITDGASILKNEIEIDLDRQIRILASFSEQERQSILKHEIFIGMSEEAVLYLLGEPKSIDTEFTPYDGLKREFFYKGKYSIIYIKNGYVLNWITSK